MTNKNRINLVQAHATKNSVQRLLFESEHSLGGGHAGRSLLFRLFQALVIVIRAITPLSYLFIIVIYTFNITVKSFILGSSAYRILLWWAVIEVLFFPYYCYLFFHMNKLNKDLSHFSSNKETRHRLAQNCFQALESSAINSNETPTQYCRRVMEGWFLDLPIAQIHHSDVAMWTAWAFFGQNIEDLTSDEQAENETYVTFLEKKTNWTFPPGHSPHGAPSARLNLDPVFATQRPLVYYAAIGLVNYLTHMALKGGYAFKHLPQFDTPTKSQSIYFRGKEESTPQIAVTADRVISGGESPLEAGRPKKLPIVFVHGIGIGYPHYMGLIAALPTDVDVYLVEWPNVAMQMSAAGPTPQESIAAIAKVLKAHGHSQACFVAHSLGTVMLSWLLKDPVGCKLVASSVIMDPVSFLLCDPTVATNFVYREPTTPLQFMMHFFVSRELFIANALSRHFAWSHNIMFVEDFLNCKPCCHRSIHDCTHEHHYREINHGKDSVTYSKFSDNKKHLSDSWIAMEVSDDRIVADNSGESGCDATTSAFQHHHSVHKTIEHTIILSSEDSIVPVKEVARYLEQKQRDGFLNFEVLMTPCTHGEVMLSVAWIKVVVGKIRDRCGLNTVQ